MTSRLVARLTAPVAMLSFLLVTLAGISAWYVQTQQRMMSRLLASNVTSVRSAQELEIRIRDMSAQFNRYLITSDEKYLKHIPSLKARTLEALDEAEQSATTPVELALVHKTREGYNRFSEDYDRILREREQWKYSRIFELIDTVLAKDILEPAHEYVRLNEEMLVHTSNVSQELTNRITLGLIALGFCGAIGGLLGGSVIAFSIRNSILQAEAKVRDTAQELRQAVQPNRQRFQGDSHWQDPIEQMKSSATAVLQRLRQTEREALRAEQLAWVGQMAAGVAHEIRNPLMAIKILVQATVERSGAELFRVRDLEVLEQEIGRLEKIVSGFLDFARPPRPEPQQLDLAQLVEQTLNSIRTRAEQIGIELRLRPTERPVEISADPNQLRQVLFNILLNALEAQPNGGVIEVRLHQQLSANQEPMLHVEIQDQGPGVAPEIQDHLFEPFVSTKESGLGLGLSICRRIIESHGGRIGVQSSVSGTAFCLELPYQSAV